MSSKARLINSFQAFGHLKEKCLNILALGHVLTAV